MYPWKAPQTSLQDNYANISVRMEKNVGNLTNKTVDYLERTQLKMIFCPSSWQKLQLELNFEDSNRN